MRIQHLTEIILPSIQNTFGICKLITLLIHYQVSSVLVMHYTVLIFLFYLFQGH